MDDERLRNLGFMWEPGSFAMIIIWALVYNALRRDKFLFSMRFFIYSIALFTTLSTAGYLAYFVFLAGYYLKKISILNIAMAVLFGLVFYIFIYDLPFISGKLDGYMEVYEDDPTGQSGHYGRKVNRFQGGITSLLRTYQYPLGYGLISPEDLKDNDFSYGVNGLASLLEMWGIFLFPVIIISIYKSLKVFDNFNSPNFRLALYFVAFLIEFFSNPVSRIIFIYLIIVTPMVLLPNRILNKEIKT